MPRRYTWFALAALIVVIDQVAKWAVLAAFAPGGRLALTGFFNLVLAFNKGAAFSFLAGAPGWQTPLFIAVAAVAIIVVSVLLARSPGDPLVCAGLALILGGALGNLIDRLRMGAVTDYIDVLSWPPFNLADIAITLGVVALALSYLAEGEKQ